jgi:hypothetical protein
MRFLAALAPDLGPVGPGIILPALIAGGGAIVLAVYLPARSVLRLRVAQTLTSG